MEWRRSGEAAPVKAKTRLSPGKIFATVLWDFRGVLLINFLHESRTINAAYYCQLLAEPKLASRRKRRDMPIREVLLPYNNQWFAEGASIEF
ncbi:uncharacterized protein LOC114881073 isoform X2 [Osmia bicornis bicornis]|uniref:uncharacterized protein LOC114881073 isoform X2 n=1 Tax=Osmia bicornis bicornis TaxID=1437191 RepID=UPI0010F65CB9|nr:uncharacterized protein LOC114881073 isoform X2 [Osmia bicornis bicornis]